MHGHVMTRRLGALAAGIAGLLALAACGSGFSGDGSSASGGTGGGGADSGRSPFVVPASQPASTGASDQAPMVMRRAGDRFLLVEFGEMALDLELRVRVHALERPAVAPFPVLDQVTEQLAGPPDTALEEGEPKTREAPGHPAQEDRLGDGVAGGGEVADVVVDEVRRRVAQPAAPGAHVERG